MNNLDKNFENYFKLSKLSKICFLIFLGFLVLGSNYNTAKADKEQLEAILGEWQMPIGDTSIENKVKDSENSSTTGTENNDNKNTENNDNNEPITLSITETTYNSDGKTINFITKYNPDGKTIDCITNYDLDGKTIDFILLLNTTQMAAHSKKLITT
ncbi:hypothetical protein HPP_0690 [Hydrangea phyllody phytoplasma]|uniref:DUF2963 domain-containing protein n=2 Tax=16SrI (Aster yellows group) TaxID=3042590 RepID=A0ABQ5PSF2_9MOLU|nr:DUF2963 domain-containing protein [Hydrangea phyllody phytoplasma]GFZ75111.1 hypothetical protein HPP_0690 [Hydrangea phyllody phytoplasma]GLH61229.1 hypothetical protein RHYP_1740 [Rhus yellows phytoplasma]